MCPQGDNWLKIFARVMQKYYMQQFVFLFISCRNAKCDGLLTIRRLGAFHPEVLAPQLHAIILSILTEVRSDAVCM